MISLFGKKEPKTKIYFTKGDKVVLGSNTTLEYAFQVGNFYNILQDSTAENSIKAFKHNLLVALSRLQFVEQADPYRFALLLEYVYIRDYKYYSDEFCDLLVKLYPKYYKIIIFPKKTIKIFGGFIFYCYLCNRNKNNN